jgi:uncharacterized protein YcfL
MHVKVCGLMAVALLCLVGCKGYYGPIGPTYESVSTYPKITLSQGSLAEAIRVGEPTLATVANDLLQLNVPIRAHSDDQLHVEYRVVWKDKTGKPIAPQSVWTGIKLAPRQPQNLIATSTSKEAVDYNLQLRWSR